MVGYETSDELKGIIPKTFDHIFGCIDASEIDKRFLVRCSYLEIYNENILDLLGNDTSTKLDVKEDANKGIYVKDLTQVIVKSVPEIDKAMKAGLKNRKVGATEMNKESSRSHSIFTIYIETSEADATGE
jgi:kinesin family protein 3/17